MASYAAALKGNNTSQTTPNSHSQTQVQPQPQPHPHKSTAPLPSNQPSSPARSHQAHHQRRRSPSPGYRPRTSNPDSQVYILTFLTNQAHHQTLTDLRTKYFPQKLNHLSAHITLFHALPGSKLESDIIPTIQSLSSSTPKFAIYADPHPMKLKRGIAISLANLQGGNTTRAIHRDLQSQWREFLSDQDAGGFRPHYTIMNKVNDEAEVQKAFEEVERNFAGCSGTVEGLTLWLYEGPGWVKEKDFMFQG